MSIDDEALARLRELPERLMDAAWDTVGSVEYPSVASLLYEVREALPALLDIAEAVTRGIDARLVADCAGIMLSTDLDYADEMALAGRRVRIVTTGDGAL